MWDRRAYYCQMGPYPHRAILPPSSAGFRSDEPIDYVYPAGVLNSGEKDLDPEPNYNPSVSNGGEQRQLSFDEMIQTRRAITERQACFDYPRQTPRRPHSVGEREPLPAKTRNQNPGERKREASPHQRGQERKRKRPRLKKQLNLKTPEQIPVGATEVGALGSEW